MARTFLIGNGTVTATGDRDGALLELYAPTLAPETQFLRRPARIGVAVEGFLRWLPDSPGTSSARQGAPAGVPIADVSVALPDLDLEIWIESYVDAEAPVLVRRVQVTNRSGVHRSLSLYFHHDLRLAEGRPHETVRRDEESGGLLHASGHRAFLLQIETHEGTGVALVRTTARDAESRPGADAEAREGRARPRAEATGWVDSVSGVPLSLGAHASAMVTATLAYGATADEARAASGAFHAAGVTASLTRTRAHWTLWSSQGAREFADLPEDVGAVYAESLLALRLHQTPEGAIVAGLEPRGDDAGAAETRWCRVADGAIAADALGRAGYHGAARRFFAFVARAAGGPAGTGGAHRPAPVYDLTGSAVAVPGDRDAALLADALLLWAAARHFERDRDVEFLAPIWRSLLAPAAARLAASPDPALGLPVGSDWWGERRGAHAPLAGAVRGGLRAAARLGAYLGEATAARAWTVAADQIARAAGRHLRCAATGGFVRGLEPEGDAWRTDPRADASLLLLGLFDDFEPEDPRVRATVTSAKRRLWSREGAGGLSRYEGDEAPRVAPTLWLALHEARAARRLQDLEPVRTLLFWTSARAEGVGLLPERLHPARERSTGTAPSLLAHAWFVQAALDYAERLRLLTRCERCGEPGPERRERRRAGIGMGVGIGTAIGAGAGAVSPRGEALPSLPGVVAHL
ncbi:MAG TPA: hypothetical protein VLT84_01115 [Acidobacteriota bacterium]|nr:hypothetical protein [Acidobacteriota bacterium]